MGVVMAAMEAAVTERFDGLLLGPTLATLDADAGHGLVEAVHGQGLPAGSVDRRNTNQSIPRRRATDPPERRRAEDLPYIPPESTRK